MVGSEPIEAKALILARGFRPSASPGLFGADENPGGAVDDAAGIARMVNMLDAFYIRIFAQGDGVETGLPHGREGGIEGAQILHGRVRAHIFVMVEHRLAEIVRYRND